MAFKANQVTATLAVDNTKSTPATDNQLSVQELAFLLNILKQATITGEQVEFMYNLIVKLQNQYVAQNS